MDINTIKNIFTNMQCPVCERNFTEQSITIVREEENCSVVELTCQNCSHNTGLIIIGHEKNPDDKNTVIDYNDVIQANKFFSELGSDWIKYLPKNKENEN